MVETISAYGNLVKLADKLREKNQKGGLYIVLGEYL